MKKTVITISLVAAFIAGFIIFYQGRPAAQKNPAGQVDQQTGMKQNWVSKTDDQLAVTITVDPIDISPEAKEWKFGIVMDTHSVELDQDLVKLAVLIGDKEREYKPLNWEGSIGGHHREGELIFDQITPAPDTIELKISGIGDVVRSFAWQL